MAEQSAFLTAYDEMQKKKREQEGFSAPAPMESVVDTVGQAPAVQSPFSQGAAPNPLAAPVDLAAAPAVQAPVEMATPASVDPIAQPDVPAAAPAVQAPQGVLSPEERTRIEGRLAGTNADIVASGETIPSLGVAAPQEFKPVGGGFSFGGDTPIPADRESGFIPAEVTPAGAAPEVMGTPESIAGLSVNGTDVVTPEATTEAGPVAPQAQAPQGLNSTQAMLQERFGSPTISGIQSAEEGLGLRTDAQGRMIDPNVDRSSFEQASADREARQAAQPDFGAAQTRAAGTVTDRERRAARGDGISDADRRDIAKANLKDASASDIARGDKVAAANGVDRKTGKPPKKDGALTDYQKASLALREKELSNSGVKQTAAEAKAELIRKANPDLPEEEIAAITSGSVRVVQNPSTGETTLLNLATGASKKVNTGQEAGLNFDVAAPENTLFSRAGEYTGAVEAAKRKGQGITGQFGVDVATDASIGAAQDFETAQNELVRAFRESSRYSATEANQLKKELNIALSPFEDPKTAEAKLRSIDKSLARRYKNEEAVALDENESIAKREDARSRARAISEFRATLGVPAEDTKPVENGNVPANIDAGDWEYMTEEQRKLFN